MADNDTDSDARATCLAAAIHLANCMVAYAAVKQRSYKAMDLRFAKEKIAAAIQKHNAATDALARAYDDALITVHDAVNNTYPRIPRRDRGTVCDPSMDAYHQM